MSNILIFSSIFIADNYQETDYGITNSIFFQILLILLLILINAFFAMSEIALITLKDNKIKKLAKEGHKSAIKILKLTKNSSNFLATIQVGVTLSGFLTSASASTIFASKVANLFSFLPFSKNLLEAISTVLITIILSYFSLVFGELVPKKIAMQNSEKISFKIIGTINAIEKLFSPFIKFLSASTNFVVKLLGFKSEINAETVTEEEILMLLDAGQEKGIIGNEIKNIIENVFSFDDKYVNEIMTHRTEIVAIEDNCSILDAVNLSINSGYSRIPVYHEDVDNIIGIIYVKDLLKYFVSNSNFSNMTMSDIMRDVIYIPKTKRCSNLFKELIDMKTQIAIIVDEYGGTEGLITIEDLIESILGNIQDEYDDEQNEITKINENKFTVDGSTSIDEISSLVGFSLPSGNYDTISGFILEKLGRIPTNNEHPSITINNTNFIVEQIIDRKITKVSITRNNV